MTDNDIIKNLKRLSEEDPDGFSSDVLNYINRLKAEIERLKTRYNDLLASETEQFQKGYNIGSDDAYKRAKSEAIREFAEELKKRASKSFVAYSGGFECITAYQFSLETIDNLVAEMIESEELK